MYTVLVADEDASIRRMFVGWVAPQTCGFQMVGEVLGAGDVLDEVERLKPDLLVLDMKMSLRSGMDLAAAAKSLRPGLQLAFLSDQKDFDYAMEAVKVSAVGYLLKPFHGEELVKELNAIRAKMDENVRRRVGDTLPSLEAKEFLLSYIFNGEPGSEKPEAEESLRASAASCGLAEGKNGRLEFVITAADIGASNRSAITDHSRVRAIDSRLNKRFRAFSICLDREILSFVFLKEEDRESWKEEIDAAFQEVSQSFERIYGTQWKVGVSSPKTELTQGHLAYREALEALDSLQEEEGMSLCYAADASIRHARYAKLFEDIMYFRHTISGRDRARTHQFLDDLFAELREKKYSFLEIDIILSHLLSAIDYAILSYGNEETVNRLWSQYPSLFHTYRQNKLNETQREVRAFCDKVMDELDRQRQSRKVTWSQRALEVVQEGYSDKELTLAAVAERLHVSPNYLAQLLRRETGGSFGTMLSTYRMEQAKSLLETTGLTVNDIAEQCGYTDAYYFARCFKKHFGQTPSQMRHSEGLE